MEKKPRNTLTIIEVMEFNMSKMESKMYKIEKNVPLPEVFNWREIFAKMEIGDSFEFRLEEINRVRQYLSAYGKENGVKFATRRNRFCWRIE
jgi:hypothetical protein